MGFGVRGLGAPPLCVSAGLRCRLAAFFCVSLSRSVPLRWWLRFGSCALPSLPLRLVGALPSVAAVLRVLRLGFGVWCSGFPVSRSVFGVSRLACSVPLCVLLRWGCCASVGCRALGCFGVSRLGFGVCRWCACVCVFGSRSRCCVRLVGVLPFAPVAGVCSCFVVLGLGCWGFGVWGFGVWGFGCWV